MSERDLSDVGSDALVKELSRRGDMPRCGCGRWQTYIGVWDGDGKTLRCRGCLLAIAKCRCG
jgi:hypothetical protein